MTPAPLKSWVFGVVVTVTAAAFFALFGLWTKTLLANLKAVSTYDTAVSAPFEPINVELYKQLFPEGGS